MAHDDRIAVAAVGMRRDLDAAGTDIEPAVSLPLDMLKLTTKSQERRAIAYNQLGGKASLCHQGGGLQGGLAAR
jgi:4'-phosphopantetheinyl transferase EntD